MENRLSLIVPGTGDRKFALVGVVLLMQEDSSHESPSLTLRSERG
jgi:hypothetical protein